MLEELINSTHPLAEDYVPDNLVYSDNNENNFHNYLDPTLKPCVTKETYDAFCVLQKNALKDGLHIIIDSGYRSYDYQVKIWDRNSEFKGVDYTFNAVALPGTSEHQSGLAFDIGLLKDGKMVTDLAEEAKAYKWMADNAHKYGFILRYPKGKENVTGIMYEPWHFRYVGTSLACLLHDKGLTMEEYYMQMDKPRKIVEFYHY